MASKYAFQSDIMFRDSLILTFNINQFADLRISAVHLVAGILKPGNRFLQDWNRIASFEICENALLKPVISFRLCAKHPDVDHLGFVESRLIKPQRDRPVNVKAVSGIGMRGCIARAEDGA